MGGGELQHTVGVTRCTATDAHGVYVAPEVENLSPREECAWRFSEFSKLIPSIYSEPPLSLSLFFERSICS